MRTKSLFGIFFVLVAVSLHAQTAGELDRLLELKELDWGDVCLFTLAEAGVLPPAATQGAVARSAAFDEAQSRLWLAGKPAEGDKAKLGAVSLLVMRAFGLKGGIMYSITHSPRYAYREVKYLDILRGSTDAASPVSGELLLQMLDKAIVLSGADTEEET
jgi:hypothetical protein